MKRLEYTVQFVTPAFLGNAEQTAQWRTPPFKTMLRQWWRVLKAREAGYNASTLRQWEGELFGSVAGSTGTKSKISIRLATWNTGTMHEWPSDPAVHHREVGQGGRDIGSHLYLGYGPLKTERGTKLKNNAAIQADSKTQLFIINPDHIEKEITEILMLAQCFGTLGGRSRNGWGSLHISGQKSWEETVTSEAVKKIARPLADCLKQDWPASLGQDEKGLLVWKASQPCGNWSDAMKELARIKIAFRTALAFTGGNNGPLEGRHAIAYPVTNHNVLGQNVRLPNQLRFKVQKTSDGKFLPTAFHFPVATPEALRRTLPVQEQLAVWIAVHKKMDELMTRIQA